MPDPPIKRLGDHLRKFEPRRYLTKEPVILVLLSTLAVVGFTAVSGLSSAYHAEQKSLAARWYSRGAKDLLEARFHSAATEFRTALMYSRDNYAYQLDLAQALLGQKNIEEASAYLNNLWDREPENGLVNLDLARIAAQQGLAERAQRYYHNAIYATWPANRPEARRQARLEFIEYLLQIGDRPEAKSELIALAANLGDDPHLQVHLGDLFTRAQDYADALAAYRRSFKGSHRNPAALSGAGRAALALGHYGQAQHYLQMAAAAGAHDPEAADDLEIANLVLRMDPFRPHIWSLERNRIVMEDFAAAGQRLDGCLTLEGDASSEFAQQNLSDAWTKMKPHVTASALRRDPDLAESAMELVFTIERDAGVECGQPSAADRALLLIARLHEGS